MYETKARQLNDCTLKKGLGDNLLLFFDFRSAFDSVDWEILFKKLFYYHLPTDLIRTI